MRIISLVFAAAVMAVGLAVSANAEVVSLIGKQAHNVLAEGEVLFATECPASSCLPADHRFTVRYDGQIYACQVNVEAIEIGTEGEWTDIVICHSDSF